MKKTDIADKNFKNGFNCAQSVFSAFCDFDKSENKSVFYVLNSFGGGIGRTGNLCGAYSGGLAVLGFIFGNFEPGDLEKKELLYSKVQEFEKAFKKEFGALTCPALLGFDITDEEQKLSANKSGVFLKVCPKLISKSIEIIENL